LVKDENGDLLADFHRILGRWKNCFCQLLNLHGVNNVGLTAKSFVSELSSFEAEIAVEKLEGYKLPGIHKTLAKLMQAGGDTLCSEINKLTNSTWNKEELPGQWKE
jgi:hypothetical protein